MTAKSAEEIAGLEYDWLARDAEGHVALFSTAGGGYAPSRFLHDTDAHDAAIDAIVALPPSTEVERAPELPPHLDNRWRSVAERGLFAFDSDPNGGAYRLVAIPMNAARIGELDALFPWVENLVALRYLRFAEQPVVSTELLRHHEQSAHTGWG